MFFSQLKPNSISYEIRTVANRNLWIMGIRYERRDRARWVSAESCGTDTCFFVRPGHPGVAPAHSRLRSRLSNLSDNFSAPLFLTFSWNSRVIIRSLFLNGWRRESTWDISNCESSTLVIKSRGQRRHEWFLRRQRPIFWAFRGDLYPSFCGVCA